MPPLLALLLSLGLTAWLFCRYTEKQAGVSTALWIPFAWLFFCSSRPLSVWMSIGPTSYTSAQLDGSPLDSSLFQALMIAGAVVLSKRRLDWGALFRRNNLLLIFFLYLGITTIWSDYPFVAIKRWIKDLGNVIMVLVVVSDQNPIAAVRFLFARCCYLLLPLSVTFIKYFPALGRYYDPWNGAASYCGATTDKNMLGMILFVCTLSLVWMLLQPDRRRTGFKARMDFAVVLLMGAMAVWLLQQAHSSTALSCTLLGVLIFVGARFAPIRKRLGLYGIGLGVLLMVLQLGFNLSEMLVQMVGRDPTLTGRTDIWSAVLKEGTDPLFGVGYYSFWLGDRVDRLSAKYHYYLNEAHNTYLETYLNTGLIGLGLLFAVLLSSAVWTKGEAMKCEPFGAFRLACFLSLVIYGITEAFTNRLASIWFLFLLVILRFPQKQTAQSGQRISAGPNQDAIRRLAAPGRRANASSSVFNRTTLRGEA